MLRQRHLEDYMLHTQAELDVLICLAEVRCREAASRVHAECPVITVTSAHSKGEPWSILMGNGGVWGIKISAVTI